MYCSDVLNYYGNPKKMCKRLAITKSYVSKMDEIVPRSIALDVHYQSNGTVKMGVYANKNRKGERITRPTNRKK